MTATVRLKKEEVESDEDASEELLEIFSSNVIWYVALEGKDGDMVAHERVGGRQRFARRRTKQSPVKSPLHRQGRRTKDNYMERTEQEYRERHPTGPPRPNSYDDSLDSGSDDNGGDDGDDRKPPPRVSVPSSGGRNPSVGEAESTTSATETESTTKDDDSQKKAATKPKNKPTSKDNSRKRNPARKTRKGNAEDSAKKDDESTFYDSF